MYIGRFAPSPTGPLHMGSLVAALASWLDARAAGGRWLVRIEDLDRPRCVPGAAEEILRSLERLGLGWDGEVAYQSARQDLYLDALRRLQGHTYWCNCPRREIADSSLGLAADGAHIYPGTCRAAGLAAGRAQRIRTRAETIRFIDRLQGDQSQVLESELGDFVLYRAEGMYAYQLAVVVDDAAQGVTDVVRGADLLDSTPRQIYLQRLLRVPTPRYLHVPAAVNAAGEKLSKQTGALPVEPTWASVRRALDFLGQQPSDSLEEASRRGGPCDCRSRSPTGLRRESEEKRCRVVRSRPCCRRCLTAPDHAASTELSAPVRETDSKDEPVHGSAKLSVVVVRSPSGGSTGGHVLAGVPSFFSPRDRSVLRARAARYRRNRLLLVAKPGREAVAKRRRREAASRQKN